MNSRMIIFNVFVGIVVPVLVAVATITWPDIKATNDIELKGRWNDKDARSFVMKQIREFDWSKYPDVCSEGRCDPPHDLFKDTYNFTGNGEDMKILVVETNGGGGCFACLPYVSIFVFQSANEGWDLITSDIALTTAGRWGEIIREGIEFKEIAQGKLGIFLHDSRSHGGTSYSDVLVYASIGQKFEKVLFLETACNDWGVKGDIRGTSLETTYQFLPKTTGFYDLKVSMSGTIQDKPFKFQSTYQFNGKSYFSEGEIPNCSSVDNEFGVLNIPEDFWSDTPE